MSAARDRLFLLEPGFPHAEAGPGGFYCLECAALEGVLTYHPFLREHLDAERIAFARPRPVLVELLGEALQSAPVLVVGDASHPAAAVASAAPGGVRYFAGFPAIAAYLAERYGIARLHP